MTRWLALLTFLGPVLGAAAGEPMTHSVFMGADFSVQANGRMLPVMDVAGSDFVVLEDGKAQTLPTRGAPVSLSITHTLKLTATLARLSELKWERVYAAGADPQERVATAYANLVGEQMDELALSTARTAGVGLPVAGAPPLALAMENQRSETISNDAYGAAESAAASADGRDTLHLSFDIVADHPMGHPYVIVLGVLRPPGRPTARQHWVGARALPAVGVSPLHVDYLQSGFPAGFRVESLALHLYQRGGLEVATTRSDNLVALTREEAFQFLLIEYLTAHPGATLPASPAMARPPPDWSKRSAAPEFGQTYFVKVDHTGHPRGLFADPLCRHAVANRYLVAAVMDVRFCPALRHGAPVDTVAAIVPRSLLD